jgi:hypothetical protein
MAKALSRAVQEPPARAGHTVAWKGLRAATTVSAATTPRVANRIPRDHD